VADSSSDIQASGGDYTTTQAWVDAFDSVTGTHTALIADEYIDGQLLANNGATAATAFIIRPQTGAKHNGTSRNVASAGSALRHTSAVIWWNNANGAGITVEDMVCEQTAGGLSTINGDDTSAAYTITRSIIEDRGTSTAHGIDCVGAAAVTVRDTVVYGAARGIDARSTTSNTIVGNTVVGNGSFGILPSDTGTVANNISVDHSSEDYFAASAGTGNHGSNIAEDATASTEWDDVGGSFNSAEFLETGDTPTKDYVAFVNKTAGSEDYHLVDLLHGSFDNVAFAGGIPSLGSGTDIDGDARDGTTPDIGADEVAAAPPSGLPIPIAMHHYTKNITAA
jgi:parallel beta-helix repeat protein